MVNQLVALLWVFVMVITIPLKYIFYAWYVIAVLIYGRDEDGSTNEN